MWSAFTTLPPALCRQGGNGAPFRQKQTVFRGHRIFVIGDEDVWDVRILDVRTKTWSTLDATTSPHWRVRRFMSDDDIVARSRMCLGTVSTRGGPTSRFVPYHMHAIDYRGDIAVFDACSDDDEDMDRPGVHVLSEDTWLPTGGRLGFTTSRDLPEWAKSKYEVDEVTVAAPPSWLAAMPDCLSMPDGGEGSDYIGRMSLVVSERACVVKA